MGVTDLSLTESLWLPLELWIQACLLVSELGFCMDSFRWAGGEVEKLLCSDNDKSLVSLTGLGFLTLSYMAGRSDDDAGSPLEQEMEQ